MKKNSAEEKLFLVATAQGGYFTARQACLAGFSDSNHGFHLRSGNWIREWRGIYRLARYPLREDAQYSLWEIWASSRQGQPLGAYSHETALSLFGLSDIQPVKLHLTVPRGYRRHGRIPDVLLLHHADVEAHECEMRSGYKVVRPFRTFIDLIRAGTISPEFFRQAVNQALERGYLTRSQYRELERMPRIGRRFKEMAEGECETACPPASLAGGQLAGGGFLDNSFPERYIEFMAREPREWLLQADYDLETAKLMHSGGRFFYAVFMCHLALEKALKGLVQKKFQQIPEKSHNLVFFLEKLEMAPPPEIGKFIVRLNSASVATRYPESLAIISGNYTAEISKSIMDESREALAWVKRQY